ncbi:hypothetical protein TWF694_010051 [Orbilia ellipsospora]|uniref:F-box domain-containing protein n=1 Tax=Orbilia ellipsospora TaxID=2528407 RepID=A0AAV9X975_9PEZI
MDRLPTELLDGILLLCGIGDLKSLRLACKRFSIAACQFLFQDHYMGLFASHVHRLIELSENQAISRYVKTISLAGTIIPRDLTAKQLHSFCFGNRVPRPLCRPKSRQWWTVLTANASQERQRRRESGIHYEFSFETNLWIRSSTQALHKDYLRMVNDQSSWGGSGDKAFIDAICRFPNLQTLRGLSNNCVEAHSGESLSSDIAPWSAVGLKSFTWPLVLEKSGRSDNHKKYGSLYTKYMRCILKACEVRQQVAPNQGILNLSIDKLINNGFEMSETGYISQADLSRLNLEIPTAAFAHLSSLSIRTHGGFPRRDGNCWTPYNSVIHLQSRILPCDVYEMLQAARNVTTLFLERTGPIIYSRDMDDGVDITAEGLMSLIVLESDVAKLEFSNLTNLTLSGISVSSRTLASFFQRHGRQIENLELRKIEAIKSGGEFQELFWGIGGVFVSLKSIRFFQWYGWDVQDVRAHFFDPVILPHDDQPYDERDLRWLVWSGTEYEVRSFIPGELHPRTIGLKERDSIVWDWLTGRKNDAEASDLIDWILKAIPESEIDERLGNFNFASNAWI